MNAGRSRNIAARIAGAIATAGGALTLAAAVASRAEIAAAAAWLVELARLWSDVLVGAWRLLLPFVPIVPLDAKILSLTFFFALNAFIAARSPAPRWNAAWALPGLLLILVLLANMQEGVFGAGPQDERRSLLMNRLGEPARQMFEWLLSATGNGRDNKLPPGIDVVVIMLALLGPIIAPLFLPVIVLLVLIAVLRLLHGRWLDWRTMTARLLRMLASAAAILVLGLVTPYAKAVLNSFVGGLAR